MFDVAAAAVKLAHAAVAGDEEEQEIPTVEPAAKRGARASAGRERHTKAHSFDGQGVRLYIGAGRRAGIRPADLVGAITGEAGVPSRALGAIEIADRFSLVEVPDELANDIIAAMQKSLLRGQKVTVRRERERA